jgi:hypothetical protein
VVFHVVLSGAVAPFGLVKRHPELNDCAQFLIGNTQDASVTSAF